MAKGRAQFIAEHGGNQATFNLVDEATVKRLKNDGVVQVPAKKVSVPKDMRWNQKQMGSKVLAGIESGDSIPKIASSLSSVVDNNMISAFRNARTMTTSAENHGRIDSYKELQDQGVIQKKVWIATADDRTREDHLMMDGEDVDIDEPFSNGLMFPGDGDGDPEQVWNCRCTMEDRIVGFENEDGTVSRVDEYNEETLHDRQVEAERERRIGELDNSKENKNIAEKSEFLQTLEKWDIEYVQVEDLEKELTEDQVIAKIGGGDMTGGSCSSLSLAYAGNRIGYDVNDFRGGDSLSFFSASGRISEIAKLPNVKGFTVKNTNDFKAANELVKKMEKDKEYILCVGKHSAIVRNVEGKGFQYLELQTATENGFKKLTTGELKERFGCRKSHTLFGEKVETKSTLLDVESLANNSEIKEILGYLNTNKTKQLKGALGHAR